LEADCKYFRTKQGILTLEAGEIFEVGYGIAIEETVLF